MHERFHSSILSVFITVHKHIHHSVPQRKGERTKEMMTKFNYLEFPRIYKPFVELFNPASNLDQCEGAGGGGKGVEGKREGNGGRGQGEEGMGKGGFINLLAN